MTRQVVAALGPKLHALCAAIRTPNAAVGNVTAEVLTVEGEN